MVSRLFVLYHLIAFISVLAISAGYIEGFNIYNLLEQFADGTINLLYFYLVMLIFFSVGAKIWQPPARVETSWAGLNTEVLPAFLISLMLITLNIAFMYQVFGDDFFIRDDYHYLLEKNAGAMLANKILILISVVLIYSFSSLNSLLKYFFIIILILLSLNYASRFSCAYILALASFDYFISGRLPAVKLIIYILCTLVILTLAAYLRSMDMQGLYSYFTLFDFSDFTEYFDFSIFYLFPFSALVTTCTVAIEKISISHLLIMLNPLPGFIAGWDAAVMSEVAIQSDVPFSTHGIVFSFGYIFTAFFYFCIGMSFRYIENTAALLNSQGYNLAGMLLTCGTLYFIGLHSGWDLRSSLRIIYYLLFICIVSKFFIDQRNRIN